MTYEYIYIQYIDIKIQRVKVDFFEMWCWRRLLKIKRTARRTNASMIAEIEELTFR